MNAGTLAGVLVIVLAALVHVFAWALCRAAARGDAWREFEPWPPARSQSSTDDTQGGRAVPPAVTK